MTQINKMHDILNYPSYLNGTTLSKNVILSIANKHLSLIKCISSQLNFKYPEHSSINNSMRSLGNCWRGVIYFIEGGREWGSCYGVNNPYLMNRAFVATN